MGGWAMEKMGMDMDMDMVIDMTMLFGERKKQPGVSPVHTHQNKMDFGALEDSISACFSLRRREWQAMRWIGMDWDRMCYIHMMQML